MRHCGRRTDGLRKRIPCGHPLTGVGRFPIWPAAQQALPRARPSTVAAVHNHALTQPEQTTGSAAGRARDRAELRASRADTLDGLDGLASPGRASDCLLDHEWHPPTQVCTQSSRARTTHPALDVERGAKPTGVGRDITLSAPRRDEVSDSGGFCSGLVQHRDASLAEDDAVTRRPHHKVVIADNEAAAVRAQT